MEYHKLKCQLRRKYNAIQDNDDSKSDIDDMDCDDNDVIDSDNDDMILDEIDIRKSDRCVQSLKVDEITSFEQYLNDPDPVLLPSDRKSLKIKLMNYKSITKHRQENVATRAKYNDDIDNINADEMVVVIDFKQNLVVGHCPREENWRFRHLSQRTCFNVTIYTKKYVHRFDIISNCLKHSSCFAKQAVRHVFETDIVRNLISNGINKVKFWADNGPHFKSNKFVYYPLVQLINSFVGIVVVSVSFFCPYHGKNDCDCHFGSISYWIDYYSKKWILGINNTADICRAIAEGSDIAKTRTEQYRYPSRYSKRTNYPWFS
eukprot:242110_1